MAHGPKHTLTILNRLAGRRPLAPYTARQPESYGEWMAELEEIYHKVLQANPCDPGPQAIHP